MSRTVSQDQQDHEVCLPAGDGPRFSVVIPAYNREGTIERCIQSALDQSHAPMEILVVDDGSKDRTAELSASFGSVVRVISKANGGAPSARNHGVREARGEWIAFLDSDDYWEPDHLRRMAQAIVGTEGRAEFYFSNIHMAENEGGRPQWERARFSIPGEYQMLEDGTEWVVRHRIPMMLQASVFHRKRLVDAGCLLENLHMRDDTHVFLRHGMRGCVCAVNYIGCQQTSDDQSDVRLTTAFSNKTLKYWLCSVTMWSDLIAGEPRMDSAARKVLKSRLAVSHMRAARLSASGGAFGGFLAHFCKGMAADPISALRTLAARVGLAKAPQA
ncbi:MAG: glycosyltransferase involved in cell wall biosynthesis [Planctomycetota bacterium]|jgi:glycosyltransferase involved in cell wall biosynthesis